jgi:hypothetical protein
MRAQCMIRESLHYKRAAFVDGLFAAGFSVTSIVNKPAPEDALLIWNRYGAYHEEARRFEAAGARVIVAENGYLGKRWRGGEWFALALGHHCGAGHWIAGGPERWDDAGVELQPWRQTGDEVVIMGQRGIGEPGIATHPGWAESVRQKIGGRVRAHPGNNAPQTPLDRDLARASSVVVRSSTAGLWALIWGIPVWSAVPWWIGDSACLPLDLFGQAPRRDDAARLAMFRRMAWAQWDLSEIRSGEAFAHLLSLNVPAAA